MGGCKRHRIGWFLPLLAAVGCDSGLGKDVVATASGVELTVTEVVDWIVPVAELPNDPGVATSILELWTDFTLLATAVNGDGGIEGLDVSELIEMQESQEIVDQLRTQLLAGDTAIADDELRAIYGDRRPLDAVRARHVLLVFPPAATPAQMDSVRAFAEEIRERALAGEDFSALAETYSQDSGSAALGGDLGFFRRGEMVLPFEEAAFGLESGSISEVIETQYGLHVLAIDERAQPTFEEGASEFRSIYQQERMRIADSTYLASIADSEEVTIADSAVAIVRRITQDPSAPLGSEASNALTVFESGTYTAADYQDFIASIPDPIRQEIAVAPDAQLEQVLTDVTRDRLILADAESRGIALTDAVRDSIASDIRSQYLEVAEMLGLDSIRASGESVRDAVKRSVDDLMQRIVASEQDVVPLGTLSPPLRDAYDWEIADDAVERIVSGVGAARPPSPSSQNLLQPEPEPTP